MKNAYFFRIFLFIALLGFIPLNGSAQQLASAEKLFKTKEPIQDSKKALSQIFEELELHFKVRLNFNSQVVADKFVDTAALGTFQGKEDIDKVLDELLSPLNLKYEKLHQNHYVIFENAAWKENSYHIQPVRNNGLVWAASGSVQQRSLSSLNTKPAFFHTRFVQTITGQVTDENDAPLPSVNIVEKGTTNGTITDMNGQFSIEVSEGATLVFSSVGYLTEEVPVGAQSVINLSMSPDIQQLEELVVTAFGLEREERSLGTSVGKVSGEQIAQNPEINVANSLAGRVSGVTVVNAGSGPGGSSRVIIRGVSSLGGNNQPLYVVDGVPIDNSNRGAAGRWGGYDRGDGIQNINPNDIENISVLKGPNAAALYGQRW